MSTAPGAKIMAPSSPASRPSPSGDLRPALTPAAGGTAQHPSGADKKEDQQIKIRLTEVSTDRGDCQTPDRADKWWRVVRGASSDDVRDDTLHDLLSYAVPWLRERVA
jgi:hypothetical protein